MKRNKHCSCWTRKTTKVPVWSAWVIDACVLTFPSSSTLSSCISLCLVGDSPVGNTGEGPVPDICACRKCESSIQTWSCTAQNVKWFYISDSEKILYSDQIVQWWFSLGVLTSQVAIIIICRQRRKWQMPPWKLFMVWKHKLHSLFTWRFCCCNLNASSATLLCCWRAACCCCLLMSIISWNCLCICSTCAWCCCMRTSYNKSFPYQVRQNIWGTNLIIWEGGKIGFVRCEKSEVTILVKVKTEGSSKSTKYGD